MAAGKDKGVKKKAQSSVPNVFNAPQAQVSPPLPQHVTGFSVVIFELVGRYGYCEIGRKSASSLLGFGGTSIKEEELRT